MSGECEEEDENNILLPCPFCGSENLRKVKLPKISADLSRLEILVSCVECMDCGTDGPKITYVDDVIKSWNERIN